jgi:hypothetical protein
MHFEFHPFRFSFSKNTTSKVLYFFGVRFRHLLTLWRPRTALKCSYINDLDIWKERCCLVWSSRLRLLVLLRVVIRWEWVRGNGGTTLIETQGKSLPLSQCHLVLHRCHTAWPRIEPWWLIKRLWKFISCLTQRCRAPSERSSCCLRHQVMGQTVGCSCQVFAWSLWSHSHNAFIWPGYVIVHTHTHTHTQTHQVSAYQTSRGNTSTILHLVAKHCWFLWLLSPLPTVGRKLTNDQYLSRLVYVLVRHWSYVNNCHVVGRWPEKQQHVLSFSNHVTLWNLRSSGMLRGV